MGRYANQTIRLEFPDLSEDDDPIFVTIRNPKTIPAESLDPGDVGAVDPETGRPADSAKATEATYGVMARLVTDWHVYDATIDDDGSEPLPLPAQPGHFKLLPMEIIVRISDEVGKVMTPPQ